MNKKMKLTLIMVCFAILGALTGLVIKEYVREEVAFIKHENIKQIEQNGYINLK